MVQPRQAHRALHQVRQVHHARQVLHARQVRHASQGRAFQAGGELRQVGQGPDPGRDGSVASGFVK